MLTPESFCVNIRIYMFDTSITYFGLLASIFGVLFSTAPYWLPIVLGAAFWIVWMNYVRMLFIGNINWVLLEVRIPKEIFKTPLAMEIVLTALHQTSQGTWFDKIWKGKVKAWFSLEIASIGGEVRFYIWTNSLFKNYIESQIYSQYPNIELREVEDYAKNIHYGGPHSEWNLFGAEFKLTKPDPYPIKTYVDYEINRPIQKEEEAAFRTDPMNPVIEFLGSLGPNEQMWFQILIQATGKRFSDPKSFFWQKRDWKDEAKDLMTKLKGDPLTGGPGPGSGEAIKAIERGISKLGFDCGIRVLYLAKKETYTPTAIPGLIGLMKQYNSETLNGFKHTNATDFDYPWQDYNGIRLSKKKAKIFDAYRKRSYFYLPYKKKPFVLNTEELATIYHFPGYMVQTPGFARIQTRKSEPPINLPV